MRTLDDPPATLASPVRSFGSYRGRLPPVEAVAEGRGAIWRFLHHKRWLYVALATDELFAGVAVVDLGYAVTAFAFAYEPERGAMLSDHSLRSPPRLSAVRPRRGEAGWSARFRDRANRLSIVERGTRVSVRATLSDLVIDAELDAEAAPPPIGAVVLIEDGAFNATEKGALMPASGFVRAAGRHFDLADGRAGYDATSGFLARRTAWRWAFLIGRAQTGEHVALNLVEGFVGEAECGLWIDDQLFPLGEGRFEFDPAAPLKPWRVRNDDGAVDLRFVPGGMHQERVNLGFIASRFVQPVGRFHGTIALPRREPLELDGALGVVEDQDSRW
jgi:hypothetical protein